MESIGSEMLPTPEINLRSINIIIDPNWFFIPPLTL